jgi:ankyrin repeat protein
MMRRMLAGHSIPSPPVDFDVLGPSPPDLKRGDWTPLMWAAYHRQGSITKELIRAGASVARQDTEGATALHLAASGLKRRGYAGLDVNAKDATGKTPLHYAAEKLDKDTAFHLLAKGADPSLEDNAGKTPADIALEAAKAFKYGSSPQRDSEKIIWAIEQAIEKQRAASSP